ncbi:hypothetical protein ACO2I3_20015 [Leptospira interrogans]
MKTSYDFRQKSRSNGWKCGNCQMAGAQITNVLSASFDVVHANEQAIYFANQNLRFDRRDQAITVTFEQIETA